MSMLYLLETFGTSGKHSVIWQQKGHTHFNNQHHTNITILQYSTPYQLNLFAILEKKIFYWFVTVLFEATMVRNKLDNMPNKLSLTSDKPHVGFKI